MTSVCDLFCGIGSFHLASKMNGMDVIFSCDSDEKVRNVYKANFGQTPCSDIFDIKNLPQSDVISAGIPCQAFSKMGKQLGMKDKKGGKALFCKFLSLIKASRPKCVVIENVKGLVTHCGGQTLQYIVTSMEKLKYHVKYKILSSYSLGIPQKRERLFLVCFINEECSNAFDFPTEIDVESLKILTLDDCIEKGAISASYFLSDKIREKLNATASKNSKNQLGIKTRENGMTPTTVWYSNNANKYVNISFTHVNTLRARPSHNYLTINGVRRPTERELLSFQNFPQDYIMDAKYVDAVRMIGNSIPVRMTFLIMKKIKMALLSTQR